MSSGSFPSWAWAVMNCSRRAVARSVSEVWSEAAAPSAAVTPGTISSAIPAAAQRRDLLARAPEHHGIAALEANDPLALPGEFDHQRDDSILLAGGLVAALADGNFLGLAPRHLDDRRRDEIVIEDDVGALQQAQRLQRQKLGIARPRADERDRPRRAGIALGLGQ